MKKVKFIPFFLLKLKNIKELLTIMIWIIEYYEKSLSKYYKI